MTVKQAETASRPAQSAARLDAVGRRTCVPAAELRLRICSGIDVTLRIARARGASTARITITPAAMLATAATMSTSSKPTKFDQRNCTDANVPPMTRSGNQTASVSRQVRHGADQPEGDQKRKEGEDPSRGCTESMDIEAR